MKLPESVRIGIHTYSIKEVDGMDGWGYVSHLNKSISITRSIADTEKAVTLLEEIGHACFEMTGTARLEEKPKDWQDVCLASLGDWLLHTLRNNPEVTEYLLKAGTE